MARGPIVAETDGIMTTEVTAGQPWKVLHVIAPDETGGAERVVHDSAVGQQDRGMSVSVLALLDPSGPEPWLVTALRSRQVPVLTCRARARGYLTEIRSIRRSVLETGAEIVHCHAYRAQVLGRLAVIGLPPATVATEHGIIGGDWKNRFYEWLELRALRKFDAVIAVSAQLQAFLVETGVKSEGLHLVQNACRPLPLISRADARAKLGVDRDGVAVGWIGRMTREKGPDVFVEAVSQVSREGIVAVMVGAGPEREDLEAAARRLGITDRIRFTGPIANAGELLSAFDLVVLSSRTEGLPISVLETMSSAVPLVATRVGDIPAVTSDGKYANLVDPEDPAGLAAAIDRTLSEMDGAIAAAREGSDWVKTQFGMDAWLDRISQTYQHAVKRRAER